MASFREKFDAIYNLASFMMREDDVHLRFKHGIFTQAQRDQRLTALRSNIDAIGAGLTPREGVEVMETAIQRKKILDRQEFF